MSTRQGIATSVVVDSRVVVLRRKRNALSQVRKVRGLPRRVGDDCIARLSLARALFAVERSTRVRRTLRITQRPTPIVRAPAHVAHPVKKPPFHNSHIHATHIAT